MVVTEDTNDIRSDSELPGAQLPTSHTLSRATKLIAKR
jgi:hypothetical protein